MYQYTPRAPVRIYPENRSGESVSIHETDLQTGQLFPHTNQAVWATGQQTAKLRDIYPTVGGNTAHTQGGFFSPVECAHGGFMPGMRGLQHGENRNKRVVPYWTIDVPGNICPNLKSVEYETMNATISMGAHAPNPLQALARLLPSGKPTRIKPATTRKPKAASALQWLTGKDDNLTATRNGHPVAWIVSGYHRSTTTGLRCEFVDVAYRRQTANGVNMETADFLTLDEAITFVNELFGGAA